MTDSKDSKDYNNEQYEDEDKEIEVSEKEKMIKSDQSNGHNGSDHELAYKKSSFGALRNTPLQLTWENVYITAPPKGKC